VLRSICVLRAIALVLLLAVSCGCTQQRSEAVRDTPRATAGETELWNLEADQRRGGHTLKRHVGKSDAELRTRLAAEANISAASTYSDKATAEAAVGEAIGTNHPRINQWLHRSGGHPNLVLDYDGHQPLGRSLRRGESTPKPCSHSVVVLKWVSSDDFVVLTSYPECR
jgi:Bacterial CdiA-CT RNAse A domain